MELRDVGFSNMDELCLNERRCIFSFIIVFNISMTSCQIERSVLRDDNCIRAKEIAKKLHRNCIQVLRNILLYANTIIYKIVMEICHGDISMHSKLLGIHDDILSKYATCV
jgi:DNA-binding protein Fis